MKFELNDSFNSNSLEHYFINFIHDTFGDLLYTEFIEEFTKWGECQFKVNRGSEILWEDAFAKHKGHITKDYVRTVFEKYSNEKEFNSLMYVTFRATEITGIVRFDKMRLNVNSVGLNKMILDRITDLERVKRSLIISVRHEIGHLIDFYRFNGRPVEEYIDYMNQNEKEKEEYHKWCNKDINHDWKDTLTRYYSITHEANANKYGCVDLEELLELERPIDKNKSFILEINTLENKMRRNLNDD